MRIHSAVPIHTSTAALGLVLVFAVAGCGRPSGGPSAPPSGTPSTTAPAPNPTTAPAGAGTWHTFAKAPIAASYYVGVWTGSELFIHAAAGYEHPVGSVDAAYNPATDTWRSLPSSPYPVNLVEGGYRAVWTGSEMLTFGSMDAGYTPATNTWRKLPPGPAGPSATVWTGRQVIMWGGGCCSMSTADGSAYDLARNVWEPIPRAPLTPRHAPGVWTGTEMIVVGGMNFGSEFADGAAYNPTTRTWRMLPPLPAPLTDETLTWTGTEVLVVGGKHFEAMQTKDSAAAWAYNPSTNTWRRLADMPVPRYEHLAAWAGDQLLVWGGRSTSTTGTTPGAPPNGVAYDPATDRWSSMPPSPLKARVDAISAWTGTELLIWGGLGVAASVGMLGDGAAFRPARWAQD
jgi:hypothetical protein